MADRTPPPGFSLLRIKRRRTDNPTPLDALVIETSEPTSKRRRHNPAAPRPEAGKDLDGEQEGEAGKGAARGIFRFAETVPLDSFSSPSKTRSLRDRIQSFISHPPHARSTSSPLSRVASSTSLRSSFHSSSTPSGSAPGSPVVPSSPSGRKLPSSLRAARAAASLSAATAGHSPRASTFHEEKRQLRYRVVEQQRDKARAEERRARLEREKEDEEIRRGLRPPRVLDSRELARQAAAAAAAAEEAESSDDEAEGREEGGVRIYDAVEEEDPADAERRRRERERARARVQRARAGQQEQAREKEKMDQFGDMLREYLTLQDSITPASSSDPTNPSLLPSALPSEPSAPAPASDDDEDEERDEDYVYDVYYRALPTSAKGEVGAKEAGKEVDVGTAGGAGFDVSSLAGLKRIGQLAGFASASEEDLLLHEQDDDPSSEEEDEADQDSNEENDYRNDYPEGEDQGLSSSDGEYVPSASDGEDSDGGAGDSDFSDEDGGGGGGGRMGGRWAFRGASGGGDSDDEGY
ncbi:hypothetical protein JCM10213_002659 [Rhodosporidiobolus nylandii]